MTPGKSVGDENLVTEQSTDESKEIKTRRCNKSVFM